MTADRVVIVGAGPTAAAAASRLAQRGVPTTVVNRTALRPRGFVLKVRSRTVLRVDREKGLEHHGPTERSVGWYESGAVGGLTNYWTAAVPRFDPEDFVVHGRSDPRLAWPIGYDDLAPWYDHAERLLGVTTATDPGRRGRTEQFAHTRKVPADWERLLEELPFDAQLTSAAIGPPEFVARRARAFEAGRSVLAPLAKDGAIDLRLGLDVERVCWDPVERRACGVEGTDTRTGEKVRIDAGSVILAAGALASIAVLLRSATADHPDGMGNNHDQVGRYVTEHSNHWFRGELDTPLTALDYPIQVRKPATEAEPHGWQLSLAIGDDRYDRLRAWAGRPTTRLGLNAFGTQLPREDRIVTLAEEGDREVDVDFHLEQRTLDLTSASADQLADAFGAAGVGLRILERHAHPEGESIHWAGGARMHTDPRHGVTDQLGCVHDTPGLVVADSSVFTTLPEKNPTLTAMALAMRAAEAAADRNC